MLHITGDDVVVEFTGTLRGAEPAVAPDGMTGTGVRVTGRNVTLRDVWVSGYKVGLHGIGSDGLHLETGRFSDNFRQRLGSTSSAEDSGDWLWPHANDDHEWLREYGAASGRPFSWHPTEAGG